MNKKEFKVKIEKIVDDYSNCSLIDVDAIGEKAYELALTIPVVSNRRELLIADFVNDYNKRNEGKKDYIPNSEIGRYLSNL